MAFFKIRKGSDEPVAVARPAETVEDMRRRARHRLIGAAVLVLIGVVGFPVVFDTQPRPIAVDIPIEIPDRDKARPLAVPPPVSTGAITTEAASPRVAGTTPAPAAAPAPTSPAPALAASSPPAQLLSDTKIAAAPPKPETRSESMAPKATGSSDDGTRAKALLEGKPADATNADGRFIVQVGAFADPDRARETRAKLERAGLKTYTHVAETKEGKRIRVRVGPYTSKDEADRAAQKIKGLELPAAILTL